MSEEIELIPTRIGFWKLEKKLGGGSYGSVYLARHMIFSNKKRAVKVIPKNKKGKTFFTEKEAGKRLRHPRIIQLYKTDEDEANFYLFFEYFEGVDLMTYMRKMRDECFSEEEARLIVGQVMDALVYAHSQGVSHRDIKVDNIMINPYTLQVKLLDWGLSHVWDETDLGEGFCGSFGYMAPEVATPGTIYNSTLTDSFSLGCLFFELIVGELPFPKDRVDCVQSGYEHPEPKLYLLPDWISPATRMTIASMLDIYPENRISLETLIDQPLIC